MSLWVRRRPSPVMTHELETARAAGARREFQAVDAPARAGGRVAARLRFTDHGASTHSTWLRWWGDRFTVARRRPRCRRASRQHPEGPMPPDLRLCRAAGPPVFLATTGSQGGLQWRVDAQRGVRRVVRRGRASGIYRWRATGCLTGLHSRGLVPPPFRGIGVGGSRCAGGLCAVPLQNAQDPGPRIGCTGGPARRASGKFRPAPGRDLLGHAEARLGHRAGDPRGPRCRCRRRSRSPGGWRARKPVASSAQISASGMVSWRVSLKWYTRADAVGGAIHVVAVGCGGVGRGFVRAGALQGEPDGLGGGHRTRLMPSRVVVGHHRDAARHVGSVLQRAGEEAGWLTRMAAYLRRSSGRREVAPAQPFGEAPAVAAAGVAGAPIERRVSRRRGRARIGHPRWCRRYRR